MDILIKTDLGRGTDTYQWNRIEDPEIAPHKYDQLISFLQTCKTTQWC